jgi:hypothetical protein
LKEFVKNALREKENGKTKPKQNVQREVSRRLILRHEIVFRCYGIGLTSMPQKTPQR